MGLICMRGLHAWASCVGFMRGWTCVGFMRGLHALFMRGLNAWVDMPLYLRVVAAGNLRVIGTGRGAHVMSAQRLVDPISTRSRACGVSARIVSSPLWSPRGADARCEMGVCYIYRATGIRVNRGGASAWHEQDEVEARPRHTCQTLARRDSTLKRDGVHTAPMTLGGDPWSIPHRRAQP